MAKISVTVPDGEFCSDKNSLGCIYEEHCNGMHVCKLFGESIGKLEEFHVNGERQRAFRKCPACRQSMQTLGKNGIITDEMRVEIENQDRQRAFGSNAKKIGKFLLPYPHNLFAEVFDVGSQEELDLYPKHLSWVQKYVLNTICPKKEADVLTAHYRDRRPRQDIVAEYGISPHDVIHNIMWACKRDYPFCKKILLNDVLRPEGMDAETWSNWQKCARVAIEHTEKNTPLHEIADPCERLDAILVRTGFDAIEKANAKFSSKLNASKGISFVWQLCLRTKEDIGHLRNIGPKSVEKICRWMTANNLPLDDGTFFSSVRNMSDEEVWEMESSDFWHTRLSCQLEYHEILLRAYLSVIGNK